MTIYFIFPDLSAGGAERVSITIARILKKNGFEVKFLNIGYPIGEMYNWITPEFDIESLCQKRVIFSIPILIKFMRRHSDAIFFSSREHVNIIGLICALFARREIIVRLPNMPNNKLVFGLNGIKTMIIKKTNSLLLNNAKKIIVQNEEMHIQAIKAYHLNPEKVVTINNPVDKDYIKSCVKDSTNPFNSNEKNFLNICNISYSKGIDILLQSWKKVIKRIPNAHLYILGRTNTEYAQSVIKTSIDDRTVTFLGFKENPSVYLKHCDCFVLSSRMEGFPNVILEAMCLNRPIATTICVNIIKDIIHPGINGFYCDIEDPESLAVCMIKALNLQNIDNNYNLFNEHKLLDIFKE